MDMRLSREALVGLFVTTALGIFVLLNVKIGLFKWGSGSYAVYTVHARDAAGLMPSADIKVSGVKVGWIDGIELDLVRHIVRMSIRIRKDVVLYDDAQLSVRQDGMLAAKYIDIVPGNPSLKRVTQGTLVPLPLKVPLGFETVLEQINTVSDQINGLAGGMQGATGGVVGQLQTLMTELTHAVQAVVACSMSMQDLVQRNQDQVTAIVGAAHEVAQPVSKAVAQASHALVEGRGTLGKLLVDDTLYHEACHTVGVVRDTVDRFARLNFVFDGHTESMINPFVSGCDLQGPQYHNFKGYFNVRLCPPENYYFLAGLVLSRQGVVDRQELYNVVRDKTCSPLDSTYYPPFVYQDVVKRYAWTWNAQFAKQAGNFAFRAGLFESTFGLGMDLNVPIKKWARVVSTLEAYDFTGQHRIADHSPHLKWLNYIFVAPYVYATVGIDDFVSKRNKSFFVGLGVRYPDDTCCAIP